MISGMLGPSTLQRFWSKKCLFFGSFGFLVQNQFFSQIFMKKLFFGFMAISVKKNILKNFINNVLTCPPNMLTFALKR